MGCWAGIESGAAVQQHSEFTTEPRCTLSVKDKSSYYSAIHIEYAVIVKESALKIFWLIQSYICEENPDKVFIYIILYFYV